MDPQSQESLMSELVHTSHIRIVQDAPPDRRAFIENFDEPVIFGVHSNIAAFYGIEPKQEYPATLDYMIASVAG
jgi:hypothetical protein